MGPNSHFTGAPNVVILSDPKSGVSTSVGKTPLGVALFINSCPLDESLTPWDFHPLNVCTETLGGK